MEVTNDTEAEAALPTRFATAGPVATATINGPNATIEVRKAPDGTYLARSTAIDGVFTTTAELGDELAKDPASFRNRKLFDFGFSEPVSFEIKQDGKAFQFEKRGANWTRNGQPVDAASAQQLIDRLRELTANGFASSAAGSVVGEYSVTVSGKPEVVTLTRQGSAVFATRAGSPDVYTMEPSTLTEIATQAAEAKPPQPPASK